LFDNLSEKLGGILDRLTRRGALTEADVDAAMREVRRALLEADVSLDVVRSFTEKVREQAIGATVVKSVTPGQMVVKIVHDELIATLGSDSQTIDLNAVPPVAIMMVGLQGSGKTTTTAKLARRLTQRDKRKVLMASLDIYRPAAMEQLAVLGRDLDIPTLPIVAGQKPAQILERDGRQVELWDVASVRFTDSYAGPVRVVRAREGWTERKRVGPEWRRERKEQNWLWVVAGELDGYDGAAVRDWGHSRWKIENHAFGELTQHWHLTHCAHHHPVAVVALLWIKIIAFTLFRAFAVLHGKLVRLGQATLNEVRKQIYRSLLCNTPIRLFSG